MGCVYSLYYHSIYYMQWVVFISHQEGTKPNYMLKVINNFHKGAKEVKKSTCPSLSKESINTPSPFHMSLLPNTGPSTPLVSVNHNACQQEFRFYYMFITFFVNFTQYRRYLNLLSLIVEENKFIPKYVTVNTCYFCSRELPS